MRTHWSSHAQTHPDTHISYDSDTHASIHLYEAELSPAESIADGGERSYSQQDIQAKSQNPHGVVRIRTPGQGGVKFWCSVLPDLKVTVNKTERCLLTLSVPMETVPNYPKSSELIVIYEYGSVFLCKHKALNLSNTLIFNPHGCLTCETVLAAILNLT